MLALAALLLIPSAASAARCSDHRTQADAQRAADTRDADGDGIYCESLPCPCLKPGSPSPPPAPATPKKPSCSRPSGVQSLRFSAAKYPNIKRHVDVAVRAGWPRIMVLNRRGADARRAKLMRNQPSPPAGRDRDEYPAAVGRGRANGNQRGLVRGISPIGWLAHVQLVPSGENRSHGASLGNQLRRFCDGTRFRYSFR
ncbi:MAG: hypothetical protein Q8O56_13975 [Solirubrobacteraceae bacterium]|nr:hypothetical protein [Solirubrobacteraceae bacterium]